MPMWGRARGVLKAVLGVPLVLVDRLGPLMERSSGRSSSDCPSLKGGGGITKLVPERYPESSLEFIFRSGGRPTHGDDGIGDGVTKEPVNVVPS